MAVLLLSIALCVLYLQHQQYERSYDLLQAGLTTRQVLKQFGRPWQIVQHPGLKMDRARGWDVYNPDEQCVLEYHYYSLVSPEQWRIAFNAKGKIIARAYVVSP